MSDFLKGAILSGTLPRGAVVPSTRALGRMWLLSRNTVLCAYELLAADGLIEAVTGSGTRVQNASTRVRSRRGLASILRAAHYPAASVEFRDPDGNTLYIHRPDLR